MITTCATLAAILLFVGIGAQLAPSLFAGVPVPADGGLTVAFLLNIAVILFGWRRSRDLREALEAWDNAERLAHRNANVDHTTGLANRGEFMRRLNELIDQGVRGTILFIDLDHFKRVNDLHGHTVGDRLLADVAAALIQSAPADACCARMGGDEFAILLPRLQPWDCETLAETILSKLRQPHEIGNVRASISASIGIADIDRSLGDEAAIRRSDVALYAAKKAGRNRFTWFDRQLESELGTRLALEEDIRRGIENGEFVPFFQPLIELSTRDLVGFETLARWRSPTRGMLEPDAFIGVAEATGLIGPLTLSVMESALRDAASWAPHLKIAVNISPVQFRDSALAEQIVKVLTLTGFPASRLELEITESAMLEDRDQVQTIIRSLKALGVRISLDDFGTGYAALAQLDALPVDRIKIDRRFISTLVKSDRTSAITTTIATLGHQLNVPITAEGVESEWIRSEISKLGCTEAQGWLFGRAVSADTVRNFLDMGGGRGSADVSFDDQAPGTMRRSAGR